MTRPNLDQPTTDDRLNFTFYVDPIVRTIQEASRNNQLPLTIGIYGRWGSGKTSLMRMVEKELTRESPEIVARRKSRVEAARKAARRLWIVQGFWGLLIILGVFLAPVAANLLQALGGLAEPVWLVAWLAACFGALGGLGLALFHIWLHGVVELDLDPQYTLTLALRVPLGWLAGVIAFLLVFALAGHFQAVKVPGYLATLTYVLAALSGAVWDSLFIALGRLGVRLWNWLKSLRAAGEDLREKSASQAAVAEQAAPQPAEPARDFQVIWFNAWKFAKEDELWAALLQEVLRQIRVNAQGMERLRRKWALWKRSVEWRSGTLDVARKLWPTIGKTILASASALLGGWLADLAVGSVFGPQLGQAAGAAGGLLTGLVTFSTWVRTNITDAVADLDFTKYRRKVTYKDHLTFLAEFSSEFKEVMTIARGDGNPVVLMLDDLDRCLPDQAVSILEAIKLFVGDDAPVIFIIGADREFIERAIEVKYEKLIDKEDPNEARRDRFARMGQEYLEKIVQLPFNLPPIEHNLIDEFIDKTFMDIPLVDQLSPIFTAGLQPNPRQVLRAINTFLFVTRIADRRGYLYAETIRPNVLAKVVIVQYRWPELFAELVKRPGLLAAIEGSYLPDPPKLGDELAQLVKEFSGLESMRALLTVPEGGSLADVNLAEYIFITARAQGQEEPEPMAEVARQPGVLRAEEEEAEKYDVDQMRHQVADLQEQLGDLRARGGDAALLMQMDRRLERVASLFKKDDLPAVADQLPEIRSLLKTAQEELEARKGQREREIKARVADDGRVIFQRAFSYLPVEIWGEAAGKGETFAFDVYSPAGEKRSSLKALDEEAQAAVRRFRRGESSVEDVEALNEKLGDALRSLLPEELLARGSNLRFRFLWAGRPLDELPWELARLDPDGAEAIALDPRHSFVRGVPHSENARVPPLGSLPLKLLVAGAGEGHADQLAILQRIKFPIQVTYLPGATRDGLTSALKEHQPTLLHLFAPVLPKVEHSFILGPDATNEEKLHVKDLAHGLLQDSDVQVVTLGMAYSQAIARELSAAGYPFVMGWQAAYSGEAGKAFFYAYYNALLRSGQAEFAITEGRRAIAATLGAEHKDYALSYSPVLYQSGGDDVKMAA